MKFPLNPITLIDIRWRLVRGPSWSVSGARGSCSRLTTSVVAHGFRLPMWHTRLGPAAHGSSEWTWATWRFLLIFVGNKVRRLMPLNLPYMGRNRSTIWMACQSWSTFLWRRWRQSMLPMCNSLSPQLRRSLDRRIRWWAASFRCPVALWKEKSFAFLAVNMLAQGDWRVCRGPFFARTGWQENLQENLLENLTLDIFR